MKIHHVQLIKVERVDGVGKESKRPFSFLKCEGIVTDTDGVMSICSYDLWPEKDQPLPVLTPGKYIPVVEPSIDWRTKALGASIVGFQPAPAPAK